MINKRMVSLKLNLFILNINSSPSSMMHFSPPLFAAVDKSAPYFTAIGNNNPPLRGVTS